MNFEGVWMPKVPVQVDEPSEWQRTYNIFMSSNM